MTITEKSEKKMLSQLKGENRDCLKIETGPDGRKRLVLDKSASGGSKYHFISPRYLAQGEIDILPNEGMFDILDDAFDF